jgi:methionyl-tRNA formyltransferase
MSGSLTTVLLTADSAQHRYVARALAARGTLDAIVTAHPAPLSLPRRIARARRWWGVTGTVSRASLRAALRLSGQSGRRAREMREILAGLPPLPSDVAVHHVVGTNSPPTQRLLRSLDVDVLCVYGTSLVDEETLAVARVAAINLHTGLSPRYRGADCAFWPLYHSEPDWLGATVHGCTSVVDGGPVYATARARLRGDEGVAGVFARCVQAGAEALADVVERVESIVPEPQDLSEGREYRSIMRGWRAELTVHWKLTRGMLCHAASAGRESSQ